MFQVECFRDLTGAVPKSMDENVCICIYEAQTDAAWPCHPKRWINSGRIIILSNFNNIPFFQAPGISPNVLTVMRRVDALLLHNQELIAQMVR